MKIGNAVKKVQKAGFKLYYPSERFRRFEAWKDEHVICFSDQCGEAICISTSDIQGRKENDPTTDNFTAIYWDNIKQAIDFINNKIERKGQ